MTKKFDDKLVTFALVVLETLQGDPLWGAGTLQEIDGAAANLGLTEGPAGLFVIHPEVREVYGLEPPADERLPSQLPLLP